MDFVTITRDPLSINVAYESVLSPSCGAVSTFVGTTRNHFANKRVVRLEYDAYVSMAEKEMARICQQIRNKWRVGNIYMTHRLGVVPVKEASVIIAISSEHREASLQATSYAIDQIKSLVPIWKKEIYDDGNEGDWKENKECGWCSVEDKERG